MIVFSFLNHQKLDFKLKVNKISVLSFYEKIIKYFIEKKEEILNEIYKKIYGKSYSYAFKISYDKNA